ncbi:LysM peptidoglycan-binding domain-containing protein [Streptomyces sp. ISL-10]|uniref:transglycosylase SLT domain-containing protein n=1 Tax=Streptomyces sp. ISL-10 TaxID=2819172 RepID=UPI001BE8B108|nr:LysM peptidoglycan-binding domain-containing protein [Streptomyces sp. ISL-10]MBT2368972.1 LysM peptidoglycan-binding domain-containing protein [Streptomyces sp. ISL-10]
MPAKGKHRRPQSSRLTRGLVAAGMGGAAFALPVIGATTAGAAQPAQSATAKAVVTAPAAAKKAPTAYTVVAGDSLAKIAEEHSLSGGWKKLYNDNRRNIGADPSLIRPGLKLTIGAKAKPADRATDTARADRSAARTAPVPKKAPAAKPAKSKTYSNDLDGWIKESLDIMAKRGIPGTYEGIHRNIMRESSGNPLAINNWDINAVNGTPSKGLLQVIDPTFRAYHVPGTSMDSFDPVANITAACNYAAARYGSIDNVNGPY